MTRMTTLLGLAAVLALPVAASAASDDAINALRAELAALTNRIQELEQAQAAAAPPAPAPVVQNDGSAVEPVRTVYASNDETVIAEDGTPVRIVHVPAAAGWTDRIKMKGDFRYRHEYIDAEDSDSRNRQRIRARAALIAALTEEIEIGVGIASGGDDPVSSNQTLGDGASSKGINLDLAYFKWQVPGLKSQVSGGKFKNPYFRAGGNEMLFDGDWNPEGLAFQFDNGPLFATASGLWLEESSSGDDSLAWVAQGGGRIDIGDSKLTLGAGYYYIGDAKGNTPFFDGDPRGNSVDAMGNYLYDFEIAEVFAEFKSEVGELPLTLFVDYVQNQDADDYDTGYTAGAKLGKASNPGTWQVGYEYRDLEADAALGLLVNSDFGGGGTDAEGHILSGGYAPAKRWNLKATYFINERDENAGDKKDFDRVQLDVNFKY